MTVLVMGRVEGKGGIRKEDRALAERRTNSSELLEVPPYVGTSCAQMFFLAGGGGVGGSQEGGVSFGCNLRSPSSRPSLI